MKYFSMIIMSFSILTSCSSLNSDRFPANSDGEVAEYNGIKYLLTKSCYDEDRLYKSCHDQYSLLVGALDKAKTVDKKVLVVYGYERCVWCNRLINLLRDSSISSFVNERFIVRTIDSKANDQTGKKVRDNLIIAANAEPISGTPHLFVVNPKTNSVKSINLKEFERNAWNTEEKQDLILNPWYGYDSNLILKVLK